MRIVNLSAEERGRHFGAQSVAIIDTDDLDFVNDKEDLGSIIGLVEQRLYGLFN